MKKILIPFLLIIFFPAASLAASKEKDVREGNAFFKKEDFAAALDKYTDALKKDPESGVVNFDLGTAAYKKGDYETTLTHLNRSLLSDDKNLKQRVQYNLGNAFYRRGQQQEDKNIQIAIDSLTQSLSHFEQAMGLDEKDADAKFNYEFVKRELERLKQQQQQQQQQNAQSKASKQDSQDQQQKQNTDKRKDEGNGQPQPNARSKNEEQQEHGQQQSSEDQDKPDSPEENDRSVQNQLGAGGKDQAVPSESTQTPGDPNNMTQQEAEMILKSYQQSEEPKGLLNLRARRQDERPVLKDW